MNISVHACFSCSGTILSDEERDKRGLNNFMNFMRGNMGKEEHYAGRTKMQKKQQEPKDMVYVGLLMPLLKTYAVRHAYSAEDE